MRAARPLPKSTPAPAMLSWSAGSVAISVASPGIGLEALRASMTGRDACPTIENDAVVQIVWHGFRPLRSVPRVPLGSRSAWKSDAIDSLMPEETPARLGLRQRVFLAQAPAAEIRGPRRFCQPLLSAVICAKFSTRRKLPKALWEKEFNASTLKNHPHDFKKTRNFNVWRQKYAAQRPGTLTPRCAPASPIGRGHQAAGKKTTVSERREIQQIVSTEPIDPAGP